MIVRSTHTVRPSRRRSTPSKAEYVVLFIAAFLDPILRTSPESDITLFRVLFPLFIILRFPALVTLPAFRMAFALIGTAVLYMGLQIIFLKYETEFFVLSYAILVICATLFIYIVYAAYRHHGILFVIDLLIIWYVLMVLASLIQIYFPFDLPNAPHRVGVARIHFGQENDASIAIASLFPLLFWRFKHALLSWGFLATGLFVIYENGTRMVILAVALLLLMMLLSYLARRMAQISKIPSVLVWLTGGMVMVGLIFLIRDMPIHFPDHSTSLMELIMTPLDEVFAGRMPEEYTSVNVRVIAAIAGLGALASTYGFGVGPGASRFVVGEHLDPAFVSSMHSFPIQLIVELGWLVVAIATFLLLRFRRQINWSAFTGIIIFNVALVASATSGAITNYFFLTCLAAEFIVFRLPTNSTTPARRPTPRPSRGKC